MVSPSPFEARISSAASRSAMFFSRRARLNEISQRMPSAVRRSGRTSTGTWYVAPPTRRDFTSSAGFTFDSACLNTFTPGCPVRSEEHTSELQSHSDLVCRLLLEKKKNADSHAPQRGG